MFGNVNSGMDIPGDIEEWVVRIVFCIAFLDSPHSEQLTQ